MEEAAYGTLALNIIDNVLRRVINEAITYDMREIKDYVTRTICKASSM